MLSRILYPQQFSAVVTGFQVLQGIIQIHFMLHSVFVAVANFIVKI